MINSAFVVSCFLSLVVLSFTTYSLYVGFGPPSENLRDPFEEHED